MGELRGKILERLTDGFEREVFQCALKSLDSHDNKLRLNNFCYSIRELLRLILHRLSPDARVKRCEWCDEETRSGEKKISRKDRARFALQGGLADDYLRDRLGLDTGTVYRELIESIDSLSKYTHIERETFGLDGVMVTEWEENILKAFYAFLCGMEECRSRVIDALDSGVSDAVIHACLRETIIAIDELASHSSVEEIYIEESKIVSIDEEYVIINVSGELECGLQWGSNSDVRNGDGVVGSMKFPFACEVKADVDDVESLIVDENSLRVDVSSWWNDYYE